MKKSRQNKIIELISNIQIETQDDLQKELQSAGFDVTQATVSRDIKELRIVKMLDSNGVYRYAVGHGGNNSKLFKYHEIFGHSAVSVCYAINNVVVKCHSGMASAACASIDMMNFDNILGTLAGEDTIFIITKSEEDSAALCDTLNQIINKDI